MSYLLRASEYQDFLLPKVFIWCQSTIMAWIFFALCISCHLRLDSSLMEERFLYVCLSYPPSFMPFQ